MQGHGPSLLKTIVTEKLLEAHENIGIIYTNYLRKSLKIVEAFGQNNLQLTNYIMHTIKVNVILYVNQNIPSSKSLLRSATIFPSNSR